jgi:osmotically-inducible protein OsmY
MDERRRADERGMADDPLISTEEGVPWDPPTDRVISEAREGQAGADLAGAGGDRAQELERDSSIQQPRTEPPTDDELLTHVLDALRASDLVSGDRIQVAVVGRTVVLRGEVESVSVADEIASVADLVAGVDEVIDETRVVGL